MKPRFAYTLIELLIATATASVLLVGLSSALFISARALDMDASAVDHVDQAAARMLADARTALRFTEMSDTAITFEVPDRDGDNSPETLRYAWGGTAGDPLTLSTNGGAAVALLESVTAIDFDWLSRSINAQDVTVTPDPTWPVYEGVSDVEWTHDETQLSVPRPSEVVAGELMIAFVGLEFDHPDDIVSVDGWTLIGTAVCGNAVSLAAYSKVAESSEPSSYTWTWSGDSHSIGWILRISNQADSDPVVTHTIFDGTSLNPVAPSVVSEIDNGLVIRAGTFANEDITVGEPGLAGHTAILMDEAHEISAGCGCRVWKPAGLVSESSFALTRSRKYATMTILVAPASQ